MILQETWRFDLKLPKTKEPTFLFTTVGDLEIFRYSGAGVHLRMGVCKAVGMVVTPLSIVRKDTIHCAAPYRTVIIFKLSIDQYLLIHLI